ncbi:MAG: arsenate reductase ArsC [Candidatus Thorarchaeota archaeon]
MKNAAGTARSKESVKRVLFLCTGNSARSQMAEALLRLLGEDRFEAHSAGTHPASEVNPFALEALRERGASTEGLFTKTIDHFAGQEFHLAVTVCDKAKQECPSFPGAKRIDHWSLEDPASFEGTYEEILLKFRETRDEIERRINTYILQDKLAEDPLKSLRL